MLSGIYTIKNIINNKMYVGYTTNFIDRKSDHFVKLRKNIHKNTFLQRAFNKYGKNNFEFEILETCDIKFLSSMENYWCNLLNTHNSKFGYNIAPTGENGKTYNSEQTRKKISNVLKNKIKNEGFWLSEKHYKIISEKNTGRKNSIETLKKMSISAFNRTHSYKLTYEHKIKISKANKGICRPSKEHIKKLQENKFKSISMIDLNNNVLSFNSINSCAQYINSISTVKLNLKGLATRISTVLTEKKNNYKGLKFKYTVK